MSVAVSQPLLASTSGADLYVEIDHPVTQADDGRTVDVIVGNRGTSVHRDNFDALLEVAANGKQLCSAATNFVTPIGPGQSIHALRFELRPAGAHSGSEPYSVRASIRYWDSRRTTQKEKTFAFPDGGCRCVALKPMQ
jgi:hypothetical protein